MKILFSLVVLFISFLGLGSDSIKVNAQEFVKAKVTKIHFSGKNQAEPPQFEQYLDVQFLEGSKKDQIFEFLQYNKSLPSTGEIAKYQQLSVGDEVILIQTSAIEYKIEDILRLEKVYWVLGFVVILFILIYRKKAILSLVCLITSIWIIVFALLPLIANGQDPVIWSLIISSLIMLFSILFTHGFNKISYSALISVIITILITSLFGFLVLDFGKMLGNNEYTIYLQAKGLDMRGILFSGILLGTIGVLDDIAITQAICINQSDSNYYKNAITMGTEHLGSMINTLFLAYLGSFLPSLLILTDVKFQEGRPLWVVFNSELFQTEIIRTLIGIFALLIIVPISTIVSLVLIKKQTPKKVYNLIRNF